MRSGKFYRKNERAVMKMLGFEPMAMSGAGWLDKEDGQSEKAIAQLKSTDAGSINISLLDIQKLEYNANVAHKTPVFIIQFLRDNLIYLLVKPDDNILDLIHKETSIESVELEGSNNINLSDNIPGSLSSRNKFHKKREETQNEQNEAYRKIRRSQREEKPKRKLDPELPI